MICTYERPIYEDSASGFCIYSFTTKDEAVPKEARNPRSYGKNPIMFTATGYRLPKSSNIDVEMDGEWVRHERYGWQRSVESCVELIPPTREGILGYLSSGLIKGIGRKTAERIVEHFGPETPGYPGCQPGTAQGDQRHHRDETKGYSRVLCPYPFAKGDDDAAFPLWDNGQTGRKNPDGFWRGHYGGTETLSV